MERSRSEDLAFSLGARPVTACLLALAAIAAGAAARWGLEPVIGPRASFIFFVPGVVVAAALAGLWPGLFAAAVGAAAALAMDRSGGPIGAGNLIAGTLFLLVGAALAVGGEWFQRARGRADAINRDLARREAHLRSILETVPDAMV